jgi:hypothetical protein
MQNPNRSPAVVDTERWLLLQPDETHGGDLDTKKRAPSPLSCEDSQVILAMQDHICIGIACEWWGRVCRYSSWENWSYGGAPSKGYSPGLRMRLGQSCEIGVDERKR